MRVELLHATPIGVVIKAIRKCYASEGRSDSVEVNGEFILGAHDKELLRRILSSDHLSTIEHLSYTFDIDGISRGCLQELARHRISSFSVQSTRYTLGKQLKEEPKFNYTRDEDWERAEKYLVMCNDPHINAQSMLALENVRHSACLNVPNDQLKYCLPESFKTSLIWTVNARSLLNFLGLRLNKRAHWEIRNLAGLILDTIPREHSLIFEKTF